MLHKNFYENLEEANLRLQGTVVTYDGEPFHIHVITNHKSDGAFRVYMSPVEDIGRGMQIPPLSNFAPNMPEMGAAMDAYADGKKSLKQKIIRKKMDSPLFNKFRPFPMGMINYQGHVYFIERRPNRPSTKQGLVPQATMIYEISALSSKSSGAHNSIIFSQEFCDCVKNDYPSPKECLTGLISNDNSNSAAAFHRNFALVRGPIDTLFFAYKTEVVAALPRSDFSEVRLAKKFDYVKEAISELNLFARIS